MTDLATRMSRSHDLSLKVSQVLQKRLTLANEQLNGRLQSAYAEMRKLRAPADLWSAAAGYGVDFAQRSILFWDALRQRGNQFVERVQQGLPPVLRFDYETVLDGRTLDRPVNYALVRIQPPEGVSVDAKRRPY